MDAVNVDFSDDKGVSRKGSYIVSCTFTKQRTGTYEIMIQKPSGRVDLPPIEAAELDLWPIKRYLIELNPTKTSEGHIDVGTIWMDRIGLLCGNNTSCRAKEEIRGESSVSENEGTLHTCSF